MHLRAHGEPLTIPAFAQGGAEEAELAAVYLIGPDGIPRRVGLTPGNEFADPAMAAQDARLLSRAKLRTCAIGPELALDAEFQDVAGSVAVERGGASDMVQGNPDRREAHRVPAGADRAASFRIRAAPDSGRRACPFSGRQRLQFRRRRGSGRRDEVVIQWEGFGLPLRNPIEREPAATHSVESL